MHLRGHSHLCDVTKGLIVKGLINTAPGGKSGGPFKREEVGFYFMHLGLP